MLLIALAPRLLELPGPASALVLEVTALGPPTGEQMELTRREKERRRTLLGEAVRQVRAVAGPGALLRVLEVDPESRVPETHPLRAIKRDADAVLASLSGEFDELYAESGRPSIPPERLLKASLLIALYSVRADRMFCEMLDYNILFRWFLDMSLEELGLDQSNFSRLRERLDKTDLACRFFDAVVSEARKRGLLSDEHFTVDGTLDAELRFDQV